MLAVLRFDIRHREAGTLPRNHTNNTGFSIDSETMSGTVKQFAAFSDALHEIHNARVWGGIHWRTACLRGSQVGEDVANWVIANAMT